MRLAGLLALASTEKVRFDNLRRHGQLPFYAQEGSEKVRSHQRFSIADGFALRLMLDLIGGEGEGQNTLGGVPPSYAHKVIGNALNVMRERWETLGQVIASNALAGGVIFEDRADPTLRFSRWFAGPVEELAPWLSEIAAKENAVPVRFLLVNAARTANAVCMAALEYGISDHPEEAKF